MTWQANQTQWPFYEFKQLEAHRMFCNLGFLEMCDYYFVQLCVQLLQRMNVFSCWK